ncbi:MAG: SH3 domain-containing protein [Cypionkella sp.]|nr:SH3 domain-containing protein [Cypionkella sp.]
MTYKHRHGSAVHRAALRLVLAALLCAFSIPHADAQTRPRPRPDRAAIEFKTAPKPRPSAARAPAADLAPVVLGPVSKQPLPRFASLKASEGNARRGPGLNHRIDWVFTTKGTPLRVVAEYENWRKVEDFEGFGGWVHFTLLSVSRTVMVTQDMAPFYKLPDPNSPVSFQAERGVLARVMECHIDWCRINADGQRGWGPKSALWGVDAQEVID